MYKARNALYRVQQGFGRNYNYNAGTGEYSAYGPGYKLPELAVKVLPTGVQKLATKAVALTIAAYDTVNGLY